MRGAPLARMIVGGTAGALVALATPATARADSASGEPSSPCGRVEAPADLPAAWVEAVEQLRAQIARLRASECEPMVLSLTVAPEGGTTRLAATTADGRVAEREVGRPDSLVAIGLGLLMSIPPTSTSTSTSTSTPTSTPTPTPPPLPRTQSVWLGIDAGGRATGPTTVAALDLQAFGELLLDRWLLALSLGGSPTAVTAAQGLDDDAYREASMALAVGRHWDFGGAAVDVAGNVSIVAMRMEYDYPDGRETSGNDVELGVGAVARLDLRLTRTWALTVSVDGRVLPGNAFSATTLDVPGGEASAPAPPAFPVWSAALRVGAMAELFR